MATTSNTHNGNGSNKDFSFTFPYLKTTDIKVKLANVVQTLTTHYTLHNATTIRFETAPPSGTNNVEIYRDTASDNLAATFYPGSAIRSSDLNDNYNQNLYVTQEAENDANTALGNSRVLESGVYVSAITKAQSSIDDSTEAKRATDRLVATTSNDGSTWTLTGNNTNASTDPKGVGYAVTQAEAAVVTSNTANTNSTNATNTANAALPKAGGTMSGAIAMGTNKITGLGNPTADQDAVTKAYLVTNNYTKTQADSTFFNISSGDTIKDGDTFPDNDTSIATTAAINDRIIDLVDDVGGFWPIASELAFPNANPDVNDGTGTIVSIKTLSTNYTSSGSGVLTIPNGTVGNSTVTITGAENSTTYSTGYGMLVETTTTLNEYTFHRLTPKATEVTTVAGKATEIGRLGTAAAVEDMGILGTTACVADMAILGTAATVTDLDILGTSATVADLDALADISSNITTAADNIGNINAVAGQIVHAEDLGLITDSLTTESGNNINTVANNINDINSFADQYKVASSTPGSPSQGDLWYDSSNTILKYYNGSAWQNISAGGILNLIEDQTPELYAALDCNNKNLTEVATVSGDNLQIDFGAIA